MWKYIPKGCVTIAQRFSACHYPDLSYGCIRLASGRIETPLTFWVHGFFDVGSRGFADSTPWLLSVNPSGSIQFLWLPDTVATPKGSHLFPRPIRRQSKRVATVSRDRSIRNPKGLPDSSRRSSQRRPPVTPTNIFSASLEGMPEQWPKTIPRPKSDDRRGPKIRVQIVARLVWHPSWVHGFFDVGSGGFADSTPGYCL